MSDGRVETDASFSASWVRFTSLIRPSGNLRQWRTFYANDDNF